MNRNIIIKKLLYILSLGALVMVLFSCIFSDKSYPKTNYRFELIGGWPPGSANDRLQAGADYPQAFLFTFNRYKVNGFEYFFLPTLFVNKPYNVLHVKAMTYELEENIGTFMEDTSFNLSVDRYVTNNEWYWLGGIRNFFTINFVEFFKDKKPDDKFLFRIFLTYSFDNEHENTQVIEYNVTVLKGEYVFPWRSIR